MSAISENATGLRLLRSPATKTNDESIVDIVAIHGIGACPDHTWCQRVDNGKELGDEKEYVNWLQDEHMLPSGVSNACIMRYGYDSNWYGEDALYTRVTDIAKRLLGSLRRHRKANPRRPMIFVCHCYGGLVVLQALITACHHPEQWPEIFDWTTGLVFMGTPFRGAEGMKQADMLEAALLKYPSEQIQEGTLRILQRGDEMLLSIVDEFCQVRKDKKVICFYERKRTAVGKLFGRQDMRDYLVDQTSGCLDSSSHTQSFPLSRNHFDLNKFGHPEDDDYLQVKEEIETMANEASGVIQKLSHSTQGGKESSILGKTPFQWNIPRSSSGRFVGRNDTLQDIQTALIKGNIDSQKRYVITGIGGMGKSEVCLRVIDKMRDRFDMIAWIDVSTRVGAEKSLCDLVANRGQHANDLNSARNTLASMPGNHLIVLDNADDLKEDYQSFLPSAKNWNVIITSRNLQCNRHSSIGHWDLQSLKPGESIRLLLEAAEISENDWSAKEAAAENIVDCLGAHTLALIQAGSYIRAKRCTIDEYPAIFEKKSQKLLEYSVTQERPRFHNVWTTFEVTATALNTSNQANADAKRLLDTFSMLHFTNFPTEVFEHTWKEARRIIKKGLEATDSRDIQKVLFKGLSHVARNRSLGAGKDYLQDLYAQEVFRLLADQVSDFLPILSDEWESDRIHDALDILTDLALIQKSETTDGKLAISMHKLTHSWARERMTDPQRKRQAWLRAGATIVISNSTQWIWADPEIQLRPHVRYFADNSTSFDISGIEPTMAEKIVFFCAELLHMLREDAILERFLDKIIEELERHGKRIRDISIPLCKVKAKNLYDLSRVNEAVEWWTAIVEAEKKRVWTTHTDRLESQHNLARALFLQGGRRKAKSLLHGVVKECQDRLDEAHPVRLAAEHEYADACGLQGDRTKAIKLFTHVISVRERIYTEAQSELLISRHQCARTYLHDGQLEEAFNRFQYVLQIREKNLPETHPELLATQHELGCCYRESGEYDKAIEHLEKVVKMRKQTLATENIEGLLSQSELAQAYMCNDQLDKAIEILRHIVKTQEPILDKSNPNRQFPEYLLRECEMRKRSNGGPTDDDRSSSLVSDLFSQFRACSTR